MHAPHVSRASGRPHPVYYRASIDHVATGSDHRPWHRCPENVAMQPLTSVSLPDLLDRLERIRVRL